MYASVNNARQLELPFLIYGTLFRAYGPLGRVRALLYGHMAKCVRCFLCQVWTSLSSRGQSLIYGVADI